MPAWRIFQLATHDNGAGPSAHPARTVVDNSRPVDVPDDRDSRWVALSVTNAPHWVGGHRCNFWMGQFTDERGAIQVAAEGYRRSSSIEVAVRFADQSEGEARLDEFDVPLTERRLATHASVVLAGDVLLRPCGSGYLLDLHLTDPAWEDWHASDYVSSDGHWSVEFAAMYAVPGWSAPVHVRVDAGGTHVRIDWSHEGEFVGAAWDTNEHITEKWLLKLMRRVYAGRVAAQVYYDRLTPEQTNAWA
jgi:hypothetical protein